MNILVIKLGAIGDVIRTTSILSGLKEKYRNCKIDWVTKKESLDVLRNNNLIDNVYLINNTKNMSNKAYDLVICLDDDFEACDLATKANSKRIIGSYLKNNQKTYTKDSHLWFDMGLISRFGKQEADELKAKNKLTHQEIMYKILGLNYKKQEPILVLNQKDKDFANKFAQKNRIKDSDIVIGINTGAGGRWQDKKLSEKEAAELIDKLNNILKNKNIKIILFGGPEEVERNKKIKNLIKTRVIDAGCNNSLMEFAALISLCNILVTSDSLALHIGTALKKRVVAFFYVTSASEIELYARGIKIIGKGKDYCSYKAKCDYPPKWDIDEIINGVISLI
ncbi:glycosyltransferase family 9 protein [Candidatus Woesearchaeota archaeon]|nr:glycosyltransferase family 9 protein [Candidatus Woesearchaeota archaeon]